MAHYISYNPLDRVFLSDISVNCRVNTYIASIIFLIIDSLDLIAREEQSLLAEPYPSIFCKGCLGFMSEINCVYRKVFLTKVQWNFCPINLVVRSCLAMVLTGTGDLEIESGEGA